MDKTMKQAVMTAFRTIEFGRVPVPVPGPGEALIHIKRIGVCGSDIHVYHGLHPYTSFPVRQGHETSGEVTAVGEGVENLKPGDRVVPEPQIFCGQCWPCAHGMYNICNELKVIGFQANGTACDYFTYPANRLVRFPQVMSYDEGALIEPLSVAVRAVGKAGDLRGRDVLVVGGGPIGNLAAQTAKGMGASGTMVADVNGFRLKKALECGVNHVVNPMEDDLGTRLGDAFGQEKLADVIIECSGAQAGLASAIAHARKGSRIVVVAVYEEAPVVDMAMVNEEELSLAGTARYTIEDFQTAIGLVQSGKVKLLPLISDSFEFHEYNAAYLKHERNPETTMKLMIRVND